mgnify:CR=1 FL=1
MIIFSHLLKYIHCLRNLSTVIVLLFIIYEPPNEYNDYA